ncbi:MAG: hypothetical protein KC438_06180 [Thermomicrobiales bacterium]|nr:hypothetical protein [Thermomicrobiales bacterium]MCO5220774.1 hypothetical protein [Thermomicrobiales bacterium]
MDFGFRVSRIDSIRLVASAALFSLLLAITLTATPQVGAQDAESTVDHPLVGSWIIVADGVPSIVSLSSDGLVSDIEATGEVGLGSWAATSPTSGNVTFGFFIDFHGTPAAVVIRASLDYDESSDSVSATYSVTGQTLEGSVLFTETGVADATKFPAEGPESGGAAIPGLIVGTVATPES